MVDVIDVFKYLTVAVDIVWMLYVFVCFVYAIILINNNYVKESNKFYKENILKLYGKDDIILLIIVPALLVITGMSIGLSLEEHEENQKEKRMNNFLGGMSLVASVVLLYFMVVDRVYWKIALLPSVVFLFSLIFLCLVNVKQ